MDINRAIVVVVCIMAGFIIGAGFRNCVKQEPRVVEIEKYDTITIRDTLRIREHTKPRTIVRVDTIFIQADGAKAEPIAVEIPITQSEYRDTIANDSSRAEIKVLFSGYNARIDEIGINYHTRTKTRVEHKKNGWGHFAGISTGPSASVTVNPITGKLEWGVGWSVVISIYGWGYHW